ncbi:MAG TPA: M23 family metallopeptidase [Bacillota bacterium]|nr:M23 family metallopeptidase [Bacillota bacterium]
MELFKEISVRQKNGLMLIGACAALVLAASSFAAFANSNSQSGAEKEKTATVATASQVKAAGIKINGKLAIVLATKAEAQQVLDKFKNHMTGKYTPRNEKELVLEEKVEVAELAADKSSIITSDKALNLLEQGHMESTTYTIQEGDNLWTIARKNDMHVSDIQAANPGIDTELLDIGQVVNLVKPEPMVHTSFNTEVTLTEDIAFTVKVVKDKSLKSGAQKVKQQGKPGEKEVTYRVVMKNGVLVSKEALSSKVLSQPVTQIVARNSSRGSNTSRGLSGDSRLSWPVGGDISSNYGSRWGRSHNGIDIAGNNGRTVRAAAAGRVVSAGYEGGYGKMVVIRHDNGLTTRYAHLARIEVNTGDQVDRGEAIGIVGSTGNTTGPHLHFEVLKSGDFRNPIGYLR